MAPLCDSKRGCAVAEKVLERDFHYLKGGTDCDARQYGCCAAHESQYPRNAAGDVVEVAQWMCREGWDRISALWMDCEFRTMHWGNRRLCVYRYSADTALTGRIREERSDIGKVFSNIFNKGYRWILAALEQGLQLCMQPTFAQSDRTFKTNNVMHSAGVAAIRSGNERAFRQTKLALMVKRGCTYHQAWDLDMQCDYMACLGLSDQLHA
jgi:hypothetical protein